MKNLRLMFAGILVATIGVSAASLLLPTPADAEISQYYSPFATSVVLVDVFLAVGSAVLFLVALRNFKPELKPAYRLLAFSTIAVGVGLLIFPYIEYYGLWDNLFLNLASYLQYLVGAPLMFFGVLMFYKKVGFKARTPLIAAAAGIVLVSAIHPFLPYDGAWEGAFDVLQYNLFKIVTIIPFVLYGVTAFMAARLLGRTGQEYRAAFIWLTVGMVFYVLNTLGIILIEVIGYENAYYADRLYTIPAILGDLGLLLAGYCFAAIGRQKVASQAQNVNSVDIVIYTAGKVADRTKIDIYLDDVRSVTATSGTQQLGPEDQQKLRDAYLKIELFLVSEDPLRSFDKDNLRAEISQHFSLEKNSHQTFWHSL